MNKISKKVIALFLTFVMIFSLIPSFGITTSAANFSGYTAISSVSQLKAIKNNLSGKYYLTRNISFTSSDSDWDAIGTTSAPFKGILDGNGYTISNIKFYTPSSTTSLVGLFGINYGTIKNLGITGSQINISKTSVYTKYNLYFGTIVAGNFGTVENCYVKNSSINVSVSTTSTNNLDAFTIYNYVGGIVGVNYAEMVACYNSGCSIQNTLNAKSTACNGYAMTGGVSARNYSDSNAIGTIDDSYNTGKITTISGDYCYSGGITGYNQGIVFDSYNTGIIESELASSSSCHDFTGGIVGYNGSTGKVYQSRNKNAISGSSCVGGIVGANANGSEVDKCYNTGNITAEKNSQPEAGGVVGENSGNVSNCFNNGKITAIASNSSYAGGVVGINFKNTVTCCYSTGALSAKGKTSKVAYIGSLAAYVKDGTFTNCYYPNTQNGSNGKKVGKALSISAMSSASSYAGFNFNSIWLLELGIGYEFPILKLSCNDTHYVKWICVTPATQTQNGTKYPQCVCCGKKGSNQTAYRINSISLSATTYTHDGKDKKPSVTVKDSAGNKLINNVDYTVKYPSSCKNKGSYNLTVTFKGVYSGTKTLSYKINTASVSKCSIKLSATKYTYNGKVKTPSVVVKNSSGTTLKKNTDYTVTYASGRKNVGKYKVTIKMKGNHSGTKTLYFTIIPKASSVKSLTAKSKALGVSINRQTQQSTGYQIQYSTSKTFKSYKTKTVSSYKTSSTTLSGLKAKTTYYVRIRTYKTVSGTKYYSAWSSYKYKKTK